MNINLLTIDSNLATATETRPFLSKSDSNTNSSKFALTLDSEKLQTKTHEKPTTDNTKDNIQNHKKPLIGSTSEFSQTIEKKQKSEKYSNIANKTESNERKIISSSIKQKNKQLNETQSRLAELPILMEQNKEGTHAKLSFQVAQITTNTQNKSPSVTGQSIKSTEIKLLHNTEKGQLGIKTVLPAKSNGEIGLKALKSNHSKNVPAVKKQLETANNNEKTAVSAKIISLTKKGNTKELTPEISVNTGKGTNASGIKPPAMNINPATVQDKTLQTKPYSKQVETDKLKLTADIDAKSKKSQNISNLSNPNSKESLHTGNNVSENKNTQHLTATSVQVIAGQIKDQRNSASNKNSSQAFEQILSHNNSQPIITEQSPISARNSTTNNPQSWSSSDVSADIGRQILDSVQRSMSQQGMDHQITVRLNPPELGKVLVKFQQQDTELTGLMEVNKLQTRYEIEQALPQLIRSLADSGIHIKRLDVMLSDEQQPGQGAVGNQSLQSGGFQQQYFNNPYSFGNDSELNQNNEWLTSNNSHENLSELHGTLLADDSINILI